MCFFWGFHVNWIPSPSNSALAIDRHWPSYGNSQTSALHQIWPCLNDMNEWLLHACRKYLEVRRPRLWHDACDRKCITMMECDFWRELKVCSLYSCHRYAIVSNKAFSLVNNTVLDWFFRSISPQLTDPGFWSSCSSSCVLCCLLSLNSNNEVEVLNCWYVLNL